jgi:hypothetical protein
MAEAPALPAEILLLEQAPTRSNEFVGLWEVSGSRSSKIAPTRFHPYEGKTITNTRLVPT